MVAQNEWRNGGIINPLFDGLTYNTSGHFAHCSYFSTVAPFYHVRAKERAKYATLLHCRTGKNTMIRYDARWISKTKSQNTRKWRNGGIINPLFDGLTYNTSGHFAHCSYFSSPLRGSEKYYATRKISARIIC